MTRTPLPTARRRLKTQFPSVGILLFATYLTQTAASASAADSRPIPGAVFTYPPARRDNLVEDYHGVKVADPYRWLEDIDSAETRTWVMAEAKLTDSYLEKIPAREKLKRRLTQLLDFEKYGTPFHQGGRYFYTYNRGLQQQSVLYSTLGLTGRPAVVVDPNTLRTNGSLAVVGYVASPDGATLAY